MVVLAAAVVPHPPILVPALATGAAPALEPLLAACDAAVAGLLERSPQTLVCVGAGQRTTRRRVEDWGTLAGYGVVVEAPSEHNEAPARLPLSLTIGRWLLERAGWTGALVLQELAPAASAHECALIGSRLVAETGPSTSWLVLGDGSNRRGDRAPGQNDARAGEFDAAVAAAFAAADLDALNDLDVALAAELGVIGRPGWQVLAGAVRSATATATGTANPTAGTTPAPEPGPADQPAEAVEPKIEATVRYDDAPFGVEYLVADWRFQ